jgi:hypothetical protein
VEQYDIDVVDDEKTPCDALQRMDIGDVRPHDLNEPQASQAPNDTTSPTQDHDQDQEDENEDVSHPILRPKPDAHRMYAQDQVVIHMARM